MPILTLVAEPPSGGAHPVQSFQVQESLQEPSKQRKTAPENTEALPAQDFLTHLTSSASEKIPIVAFDVDHLTDSMVSKLAASLLGHVLFLKGQIPLPVIQLSRMQTSKSSPRALKLRTELLSSYDTLSSHLNSTFTALSTALARSKPNALKSDKLVDSATSTESQSVGRPYLAILVGSSLTSAKSRVVYGVDGLETKIWGSRDDLPQRPCGSRRDDGKAEEGKIIDSEEDEGDEDEETQSISEDANSDEEVESPNESEDELSATESDDEEDDTGSEAYPSSEEATSPPASRSPSPGPPSLSYAEDQKRLQAADRLFSRTLALADADGNGMSADIAPTQTYIVLRAPRRFAHPAWIPRQNISASLENTLNEFLVESGLRKSDSEGQARKRKGQVPVEGVWVTPREGLHISDEAIPKVAGDEWDEMIWWSWDGKIVGFSEW